MLYVPYVSPRDFLGAVRAFVRVASALRGETFDLCVSTGAAVAVSGLLWAKMKSISSAYVESVARTRGPSLTGRIVQWFQLGETFTQHPRWASGRWRLHPSVLGGFRRRSVEAPGDINRLFVTVGTIRPYRFDSIVDALVRSGVVNHDTIWQLGETQRSDVPGTILNVVSTNKFKELASQAGVVVTHGGVGNVIALLQLGVYPIVVPRRRARDEHVDDHQREICEILQNAGIALVCEADELTKALLETATRFQVEETGSGPV